MCVWWCRQIAKLDWLQRAVMKVMEKRGSCGVWLYWGLGGYNG